MAASMPIRDVDNQQAVVFTQHFTSGPATTLARQNDDVDTIAIEKQEEWIKKRKVEQVTTKQIETRVKRQVIVTEDGQVVDDSGPQVTTRTTEDTETKREEHTEKTGGDEDGTVAALPPEGWVAIPGAVIVREKHEKKSNTRDEIDERLETEQVHHLGHLTHQELEEALEKHHETGEALTWRRRSASGSSASESGERQLAAPYTTGKRVVHQSRKHKRIIDQENTEERSEEKDGRITTETKRHEHHEEIDDDEEPDEERPASDTSSIHELVKETRNNYTTIQDEDQVEYIAVPKGGHVSAGVKLGHGPRQTTQKTVQYDGQGEAQENIVQDAAAPLPADKPAVPAQQQPVPADHERTDALTKKPLDLEAEEETRKLETSRWLESHFGSESSEHSSGEGSANGRPKKKDQKKKMPSQVSSGGINVTMTSDPSDRSDRYDPNQITNPEPIINTRIYAQTGGLTGFNRPTQQNARFGTPNSNQQTERVLPRGFGSPPQSPTYKSSTSGYQSALNNGKPELYRNLSAENNPTVKRAASFNQSGNYSWMNKEELRGHSSTVQARQSFLSSMNTPDKYRQQQQDDGPTYAAPIQKRWPPPKPIDDDEDVRTSTPVYQQPQKPNNNNNNNSRAGGTIIRLGPTPVVENGRKQPGNGIARTQSLFHASSGQKQPTESPVYSVANNNTNSRMNLLNSSLQSVPEREQRSHFTPQRYFVDTERSFQSLNPSSSGNPKVIQSYTIKTPPPRPAPPSHYGSPSAIMSPSKLRGSESFRFPRSPPMFADDLTSPPVRPVRRKSKRAAKTDSGTQTIRNDMIQQQQSQTLDRPNKPMKKYYLGEEPFSIKVTNGQVEHMSPLVPQQPMRNRTEVTRSQTLPRRPSKPLNESSIFNSPAANNLSNSRVFSDQDRSLNETSGGGVQANNRTSRIVPITPAKPTASSTINLSTSAVNRSQSFHVENQSATGQNRRTSLLNSTPLRSVSIRAANSPLYKSTSFLNRSNSNEHQPFASLKSPGIVTSISKSQLDLNKSSNELNNIQPASNNSALYTLPRRRSSAKSVPPPIEIQQTPPTPVGKVQAGISERLAQLSPTSPTAQDSAGARGETYSSLHRRKMQAASSPAPPTPPPPPPQPESPLNFQSSTKATHRSYRAETIKEENETKTNEQPQLAEPELEPEARSLKDRIALLENAGIHYANPAQTLPRVVGGKTKAPPPPPPPRVSSALQTKPRTPDQTKEGSPEVESIEKRQKFLEGLLNTAPELFMHIHGDENLKEIRLNREDVVDGKSGRLPRTPSPSAASPAFNNRVFTSTPSNNNQKANHHPGFESMAPLTPPPLLIRSSASPFGSQRDLALRRGSLNSTGSGSIIPAVKIPAPVNYSETVRIKSNQDPDSQSDSVQSYSKRVQPFVDGFSSETKQSSQQTTMSRSQYSTDRRGSSDGSALSPYYHSIRPQQSGGVIIQVRGNGQ